MEVSDALFHKRQKKKVFSIRRVKENNKCLAYANMQKSTLKAHGKQKLKVKLTSLVESFETPAQFSHNKYSP